MRNLKKLISVVLVVAMIASLCTVGMFSAAAADTYSETTKYPEAAAVITGIKVMDGYEDGTMRYDAKVTREEAATIICKALIGVDSAAKLATATTSAPFKDVAANRWSAGYIAYLKEKGIVAGVTDTEFDPTAEVTGLQFAKMLLCAAGYGQNKEYEGSSWDVNVITDANTHDVFANTLATDLTKAATREECMLYAFNAMTKIPTVSYNKLLESYYTGSSALSSVTGTVDPTVYASTAAPYHYTLAYTNFKLYQTAGNGTDVYGRPSANWVKDGTTVAADIANETPVATLKGKVYSKDIYTAVGKTAVKTLNTSIAASATDPTLIDLYVNGVQNTTMKWTAIAAGAFTNVVSGIGDTVELYYKESTNKLTIVVISEFFGKVTKVNTTANTLTVTAYNGTATYTGLTVDGDNVSIAGYAKDDYVLLKIAGTTGTGLATAASDTVTAIAEAKSVTGTCSAINGIYGTAVIGGTTYVVNNTNKNIYTAATFTFAISVDSSYQIYLDSQGNAIYQADYDDAAATDSYQYVYVMNTEAQVYTGSALSGNAAAVALTVVYPAGGKAVLYYNIKYSASTGYYFIGPDGTTKYSLDSSSTGSATTLKAAAVAAIPAGWYSYTTNDDSKVTLKNLNTTYAAKDASSITLATGRATIAAIAGYTANSSTVVNVIDNKGNVATYTGITNFPGTTYASAAYMYTHASSSKVLKTVNIFTGATAVSNKINFAYCLASNGSVTGGYSYTFYVDGKITPVVLTTASCTAGYVYDLTYSSGEYTADLVSAYKNTSATTDAGTVNAGYGFSNAGAANTVNYGYLDMTYFAYKYYEYATIATVDKNFVTTTAVTDATDSVCGIVVGSNTYYYDSNTVIYDCVNGGTLTSLTAGQVFVGYVDEAGSTTYAGSQYLSHIWVVG